MREKLKEKAKKITKEMNDLNMASTDIKISAEKINEKYEFYLDNFGFDKWSFEDIEQHISELQTAIKNIKDILYD